MLANKTKVRITGGKVHRNEPAKITGTDWDTVAGATPLKYWVKLTARCHAGRDEFEVEARDLQEVKK